MVSDEAFPEQVKTLIGVNTHVSGVNGQMRTGVLESA
jgi:hypothetical protein